MRIELRVPLVAIALAWAAHAAGAEPTAHERAAESFQQARAAFARREFTAAAAAFEQAAAYEPHPVAWLDAAEAWAKADEPLKAAVDCDRVLDDPAATAVHRGEAERRLKVLEKRIATIRVRGEPGERATLDGGAPFALPARKRTTPGVHVVSIGDGRSPPRNVDVTARLGETVDVEARPAPAPAPAAAPAPVRSETTSRSPPTASWIAFGAAAAALGATGVFGALTVGAKNDFDRTPTPETRDAFYRERLATNVSLGVAVVAAGIGVVFWLLSPSETRTGRAGPGWPAF